MEQQTETLIDPDWPVYHAAVLRPAQALVASGYCSLEVDCRAEIDVTRPTIWVANHAGWLPIDMAFFGLGAYRVFGSNVTARCLVHDGFYRFLNAVPGLRQTFARLCLPVSTIASEQEIPQDWSHIGIYPEGAAGNTKPFWRAYQTQRFRSGFVRLAASRGAQIVPVALLGGEECVPVGYQLKLFQSLLSAPLPVPLFPVPLPARWRVVFHSPVEIADIIGSPPHTRDDYSVVADRVRATVQHTLDRETRHRPLPRLIRSLTSRR